MTNSAEMSDGLLARAAAEGNLAAFESLIGRYQRLLYRDALGYLGSHDEALDAVQETLIGSLERFGQLRQTDRVGPWLRTAVRHRSLNMLRAHQRRTAVHSRYSAEAVEAPPSSDGFGPGPAAGLLDRLPAASARAFLLHYVDDVPLEEVARQLQASTASVKQRLYRARRHLQKEALAMARQQRSDLPDDFAARVVAHLLQSGRDDRLYMRYDAARSHFDEALELEPEHPTALLEWGRTYHPFGWPDQDQVGALERAAQAAPDSLEVLSELEMAYRQPGYEEQAESLKKRLLELADQRLDAQDADATALYCKARLLRGGGDFADALDLLQRALQQAPDDQPMRYEYGLCLSRLERYDEAVPVYQQVLQGDAKTFWAFSAHRQLATHLAFQGADIDAAIPHMEAAWQLSQWPNEAGNLIYFYSGADRLDQALALYESKRDWSYHPRAWATLGVGYAQAGQWKEAERVFAQALEAGGSGDLAAEVHLHLARIAHRDDSAEHLAQHLDQGLRLDPQGRAQLAGAPAGSFWPPWTRWLVEALEVLAPDRPPVQALLQAVKSTAD